MLDFDLNTTDFRQGKNIVCGQCWRWCSCSRPLSSAGLFVVGTSCTPL
jgi:hypothetical protein